MAQGRKDAILIIENEANLLEIVKEALAQSDIEAELLSAKDGLEGVDAIFGNGGLAGKNEKYCLKLILLNLSLEKLTGAQVLHLLRSEEKTWDIPAIIVSGNEKQLKQLRAEPFRPGAYVLEADVNTVEQMVKVLEENWPKRTA